MSQRFRHRAGSVALTALFAAAPLLPGTAAWGQAVASGQEVVFTGAGVLGVTCAARPSRTAVTVPAGSTLRVVNRTGHRARLTLDGATQGELGNTQSTEVLFRRGPVTLGLRPSCVLGSEPPTVRVTVTSLDRAPASTVPTTTAAARTPPAAPPPAGSPPATGGQDAAPQPVGVSTGMGAAPAGGPTRAGRQQRGSAQGAGSGQPTRASAATADAPAAGTTSAGAPAAGGLPGGAVPAPTTAVAEPVPGSADDGAAALADGPAGGAALPAAAEPLVAMDPVSDRGPIGLLALIAAVCVIGVSAGAIRTIAAQRASRTIIA